MRTIRGDLKKELSNSPTRIVVLWADPNYESIVLHNTIDNNLLGSQFTWILREPVPFECFNKTDQDKLIGILTVEPIVGSIVNGSVNTTLLNAALDISQLYERETFLEGDEH